MRGKHCVVIVILLFLIGMLGMNPNINSTDSKGIQSSEMLTREFYPSDVNKLLANASTVFTENRGQLENDDVRFYAQGGGLWFTDDGVWFEVREEIVIDSRESEVPLDPMQRSEQSIPREYNRVILKQEFVGANLVRPVGRERLSWNSNFFYGNDSLKWCTEVPNYREIYYENLYDGIDLRYYTNENGLKYDFIVHPGADIKQIRIRYYGEDGLKIDSFENLVVKTSVENIIEGDLFIYQNYNKAQHQVNGQFKIYNNSEYGFELLDHYDRNKILIIDPHISLEYSTYIGGFGFDESFHIDVDSNGFAFVSGWTNSSNFPNTTGAYDTSYNGGGAGVSGDGFIYKLSGDGSTLMYSTFIGGSDYDTSVGIVIDSNGSAIITGETISYDFPTTAGAYDTSYNGVCDGYILKLNQDGSDLVFSTFIGGTQGDWGEDIDLDSNNNVIVGGHTTSPEFPNTTGAFDNSFNGDGDGFILKLNHNGSKLIYSTFIGGSNDEYVHAIEIDSTGNVFVVEETASVDFPVTPGAYDVTYNGGFWDICVLKLNSNGSGLIYSTYIGGSGVLDGGIDVALDSDGNAYIVGVTYSPDFPNTTGAYDTSFNGISDVFVIELNYMGSALIFSTFIGGNDRDGCSGIAVDPEGNVILTGYTKSTDFPITPGTYDNSYNGGYDAFISRLSANGSELLYSTYLGGKDNELGYYFGFDLMNDVYMTGATNSSDFPTTPGAFDTTHNGDYDGFVIKLALPPIVIITSVSLLKNNETVNITYSKLCPYTFRTKITDNPGLGELKRVRLSLDPLCSNIHLIWNRITNKFSKINDPNNFIILEPSSRAYDVSLNGWAIDFNVTFNWTYPDEMFHNVQVYATSKTLAPVWYNVSKLFCVENDLVFNGTLSVTNENNKTIADGALVRDGEKLNWTGLTVVYENTTDVYPPADESDVSIWDEIGDLWLDSPAAGENFTIQTIAASATDLDGNMHVINLTSIPPKCDATNETFTIKIDGDNVTFLNPTPNNTTWQTISEVPVSVNITDIGGGFVNGSSVKYCYSTNNGTNWSNWETFTELESAISLEPNDVVTFPDGKNNLIKWKAKDSVGNGPVESPVYQILVDTEIVEFSNAFPSATNVSTREEVEVGITITDKTSGVNASSIEYKISNDWGKTWTSWVPVSGLGNEKVVKITVNVMFSNGTGNRIRWRASDLAGNGPTESMIYTIKINTWLQTLIPRVKLWSPLNGSIITTT